MAACWALKEKYWLSSLKITLEAQSGLQFWHIVKKHMQQIRTYCSSGGVIRAFEPGAPLLCSYPLDDGLTPSLSYSHYPSQHFVMRSHLWWYGIPVCHLVTSFTNNMRDVLSICLSVYLSVYWGKGHCVRMGETCEGDFLRPQTCINIRHWLWLQHSLLFNKCCGAKEDRWGSWGVTGTGEVGVEEKAEEERGQAI